MGARRQSYVKVNRKTSASDNEGEGEPHQDIEVPPPCRLENLWWHRILYEYSRYHQTPSTHHLTTGFSNCYLGILIPIYGL